MICPSLKAPRAGFDHRDHFVGTYAPTAVGVTADCSATSQIVLEFDGPVDQKPGHLFAFPSFYEAFGSFSFGPRIKPVTEYNTPWPVALGKAFAFAIMIAQSPVWIIRRTVVVDLFYI